MASDQLLVWLPAEAAPDIQINRHKAMEASDHQKYIQLHNKQLSRFENGKWIQKQNSLLLPSGKPVYLFQMLIQPLLKGKRTSLAPFNLAVKWPFMSGEVFPHGFGNPEDLATSWTG